MSILQRLFGPPSQDSFAEDARAALIAAGGPSDLVYDPANFALVSTKDERTIMLGRFYDVYISAPRRERSAMLEQFTRTWTDTGPDTEHFENVRSLLLPVVRSRCYFEFSKLTLAAMGRPFDSVPFDTIGTHISVSLVIDREDAMSHVPAAQAQKWELNFEQLLPIAIENLRSRTDRGFSEWAPGLFASHYDDSYDSSRLLLTEMIAALPLDGEPVAVVPHRNLLLITGSANREGLAACAQVIEESIGDRDAISAVPLVLRAGRWQEFPLPFFHPLFQKYELLRVTEANMLYEEQKRLLEEVSPDRQEFIASYQATRHEESGAISSSASWTDGAGVQLLPKAERISLVRFESGKPILAGETTLNDVIETAPHLVEDMNIYPPRYRVRGFPSSAELGQMIRSVDR